MTARATILISSGDPVPSWHLTEEQDREFREKLASLPVPNTTTSGAYQASGYRGVMVRDASDERWVVYRGWVRGGVVARVDDGRALEAWLLETGRGTAPDTLLADLLKRTKGRS